MKKLLGTAATIAILGIGVAAPALAETVETTIETETTTITPVAPAPAVPVYSGSSIPPAVVAAPVMAVPPPAFVPVAPPWAGYR
jgi:hypothetical protein